MRICSSSGGPFTRRRGSVKGIRALFGWLASRGLHQDGVEQPRTLERAQPEFLSRFGWAGGERFSAGFGFRGARKGQNGRFWGKWAVLLGFWRVFGWFADSFFTKYSQRTPSAGEKTSSDSQRTPSAGEKTSSDSQRTASARERTRGISLRTTPAGEGTREISLSLARLGEGTGENSLRRTALGERTTVFGQGTEPASQRADREPSRFAARPQTKGHGLTSNRPAGSWPLRTGTVRGPAAEKSR
jgi:hypothetical protein